jgi:signal transduction histidine kinase/ABC-type amino acid transport substrate-binding protein
MTHRHSIAIIILLLSLLMPATAQTLSNRYTKERPVVIVCDWDKPPYEFLNDHGEPTGSNIDIIRAVMDKLGLSCKFVMKEWTIALKTFERGQADIILANARRYSPDQYAISENIINYNRIRVAMLGDSTSMITFKQLEREGVVFKPGDYSAYYFTDEDTTAMVMNIEYQSPKVALMGIANGDYKYYVWGEESLKWKLKELGLSGITLNDVGIPISEVHFIGRDRQLIEEIDDQFSRLKQAGNVADIQTHWFHPEQEKPETSPTMLFIIIGILLLAAIAYGISRLMRAHVKSATRNYDELNDMMIKALHMGNFNVMEYDIAADRMVNRYGNILPDGGLTLSQFADRIHPDQQEEFRQKIQQLINGREQKFDLDKRWNAGTAEHPRWLTLNGHAICETDENGQPAFIINAIHNVTHEVEEDEAIKDLNTHYNHLVNMPFLGMSFYDKDGWLISINDSMKELCGISDDTPDSKRYWESVNMYDVNNLRSIYKPEDRSDTIVCQHLCEPEMGIDKYIEFSVRPLCNINGQIVNYLISAFDNTNEHNDDHQEHLLQRRQRQLLSDIETQKLRLEFMLRERPDKNELSNARQQLQVQTEEAQQSVGRKSGFMASMTHELRTPLNAILGFSSVLLAIGDDPERSDYVRIIRNSSDMLQRLINDIIEASRISEGAAMVIQPKHVDFTTRFDDMCTALRQRVQNPDVEFITDNPYEHLYTTVDTERIMQILTNFVTNAVKFTTQGHIHVGYKYTTIFSHLPAESSHHTSKPAMGLYIYCRDTGIGIPADKQDIIFNRFVKLDEFVQGTGMGLAISKSIAESCGGQIGVSSEGPGKGSSFWAWIPCERYLTPKT